jgi:hypothetical protein
VPGLELNPMTWLRALVRIPWWLAASMAAFCFISIAAIQSPLAYWLGLSYMPLVVRQTLGLVGIGAGVVSGTKLLRMLWERSQERRSQLDEARSREQEVTNAERTRREAVAKAISRLTPTERSFVLLCVHHGERTIAGNYTSPTLSSLRNKSILTAHGQSHILAFPHHFPDDVWSALVTEYGAGPDDGQSRTAMDSTDPRMLLEQIDRRAKFGF